MIPFRLAYVKRGPIAIVVGPRTRCGQFGGNGTLTTSQPLRPSGGQEHWICRPHSSSEGQSRMGLVRFHRQNEVPAAPGVKHETLRVTKDRDGWRPVLWISEAIQNKLSRPPCRSQRSHDLPNGRRGSSLGVCRPGPAACEATQRSVDRPATAVQAHRAQPHPHSLKVEGLLLQKNAIVDPQLLTESLTL